MRISTIIQSSLAEPDPLPPYPLRGGGKGLAHSKKAVDQIETNSMNNIKIPHVQMLAKYFLCEQNFYSVPLQRVKKKWMSAASVEKIYQPV